MLHRTTWTTGVCHLARSMNCSICEAIFLQRLSKVKKTYLSFFFLLINFFLTSSFYTILCWLTFGDRSPFNFFYWVIQFSRASREFKRLVIVGSIQFFLFLIEFFIYNFIIQYKVGWKLGFVIFLIFFSMEILCSHGYDCVFDGLTQVNSSCFLSILF